MLSDSIAGFLDTVKANRVLFPDQVEQLIRQPDAPQSGLAELCAYLLERGVLTRYQADAIREGRGQDLTFAAYPVIDAIGPCPGGTAYRALHPSLRTPLVLRRLSADAFSATDTAQDVVNRARALGTLPHPNLLPLLDAGVFQGQPYAVLEPPADAAPLDVLLAEVGGATPGFLAAEYGCAIASALRLLHERGGWHGEIRPGVLLVGPLAPRTAPDGTTRRRPAPNASVKLSEAGLIPVRSPAAQDPPDASVLAYLPPERLDASAYDARGDIYGLGASLYLMLTGRPPHAAESAVELVTCVRSAAPAPLAALRPDVPAAVSELVMRMLEKRPEDRPQTAYEVETALAPFCRPGRAPAAPRPIPVAGPASGVTAVPFAVPVATAVGTEPGPEDWGVDPDEFAEATATAGAPQPRRRALTAREKSRSKVWIALGLCLHLSAMGLLAAWLGGCINSDPAPEPPANKSPSAPPKPSAPQQNPRTKTS